MTKTVLAREERPIPTIAAKSPRGGKPRLYSAALAEKIIRLAETGITYPEIARVCGIHVSSLYYWLSASEADKAGYRGFRDRFYRARAVGYTKRYGVAPDPPGMTEPVPATGKPPAR
jgi:hypothetical protein